MPYFFVVCQSSNGTANITHAGLYNDTSSWTYYDDIVIKSYAVRVLGGEVLINKGSITNSVGGGLCCNGGNVTLGNKNSSIDDITITTTGYAQDGGGWWCTVNDNLAGADGSWDRHKTITGGHAVEINGGSLEAFNGRYIAAFGDGIVLNVPNYTGVGDRTTVNVHAGEYIGNMTNETSGDRSGPGASYGLKVFGPAIINIYDGRFDGKGGGACVSGIYDYSSTNTKQSISYNSAYPAEVYVYEGNFGSESATDGFMIYDYSKIVFGAYTEEQLKAKIAAGEDPLNLISISSTLAPFSINWITFKPPSGINSNYDDTSCDVSVYYGNYTGRFAGWNKDGNASAVIFYNYNPGYARYNNAASANYQASVSNQNNDTPVYYKKDP